MSRVLILALVLLAASPVHADASAAPTCAIRVDFVHPERYTDIKEHVGRSSPDKNRHLKAIQRLVQAQACKRLTAGEQLHIRFTDIDLAGDYKPGFDPGMTQVRIIEDLYPPRLQFTFELKSADGLLLNSGDENLRDLAFLMGPGRAGSNEYRFEQHLLERWLRKTLRRSS